MMAAVKNMQYLSSGIFYQTGIIAIMPEQGGTKEQRRTTKKMCLNPVW